jgi:dihydropteroate synthase
MGIINMSPDSFYSNSRCSDTDDFERKFATMTREGADIIDIGACSTRPGSTPISEEDEWNILEPVLRIYSSKFSGQPISIDTFRASTVRKAHDITGPFIVNDISSGEDDKEMLATTGALKLPYIAMHKKGTPYNMQQLCQYDDVVEEVREYFERFVVKAHSNGIEDIALDPGFGFAKNTEHWHIT